MTRLVRSSRSLAAKAVLSLLLIELCGCAASTANQSEYVYPEPPCLPSAVEMEVDGVSGLWMNATDVENLMLWMHNVSPDD